MNINITRLNKIFDNYIIKKQKLKGTYAFESNNKTVAFITFKEGYAVDATFYGKQDAIKILNILDFNGYVYCNIKTFVYNDLNNIVKGGTIQANTSEQIFKYLKMETEEEIEKIKAEEDKKRMMAWSYDKIEKAKENIMVSIRMYESEKNHHLNNNNEIAAGLCDNKINRRKRSIERWDDIIREKQAQEQTSTHAPKLEEQKEREQKESKQIKENKTEDNNNNKEGIEMINKESNAYKGLIEMGFKVEENEPMEYKKEYNQGKIYNVLNDKDQIVGTYTEQVNNYAGYPEEKMHWTDIDPTGEKVFDNKGNRIIRVEKKEKTDEELKAIVKKAFDNVFKEEAEERAKWLNGLMDIHYFKIEDKVNNWYIVKNKEDEKHEGYLLHMMHPEDLHKDTIKIYNYNQSIEAVIEDIRYGKAPYEVVNGGQVRKIMGIYQMKMKKQREEAEKKQKEFEEKYNEAQAHVKYETNKEYQNKVVGVVEKLCSKEETEKRVEKVYEEFRKELKEKYPLKKEKALKEKETIKEEVKETKALKALREKGFDIEATPYSDTKRGGKRFNILNEDGENVGFYVEKENKKAFYKIVRGTETKKEIIKEEIKTEEKEFTTEDRAILAIKNMTGKVLEKEAVKEMSFGDFLNLLEEEETEEQKEIPKTVDAQIKNMANVYFEAVKKIKENKNIEEQKEKIKEEIKDYEARANLYKEQARDEYINKNKRGYNDRKGRANTSIDKVNKLKEELKDLDEQDEIIF